MNQGEKIVHGNRAGRGWGRSSPASLPTIYGGRSGAGRGSTDVFASLPKLVIEVGASISEKPGAQRWRWPATAGLTRGMPVNDTRPARSRPGWDKEKSRHIITHHRRTGGTRWAGQSTKC